MRFRYFLPLLLLAACRTPSGEGSADSTPQATATIVAQTPQPVSTATAPTESGNHLTVCMSAEPDSLYWHSRNSVSKTAVLHGIYENDLVTLSYEDHAQGLERLPSLANGDATIRIVPVDAGDRVLDVNDEIITLELGSRVMTADGAVAIYEGATLFMRQLAVDFTMKQRFWSDGQPVTAADSVYSFQLAADPATPGDKYEVARTAGYQATGNLSVRWIGLPGFIDDTFQSNFHHPLPRHAWQGLTAGELRTASISSRLPMGDGPYQIVSWLPGERIRLEPNPNYYRLGEMLPRLDSVNFRFIPNTNERISELLAGRCDLLTHDGLDPDLIPFFQETQAAQLANTLIGPSRVRYDLLFGINSWGDYGDDLGRTDWFEDSRVRQAIAMCINRQQLVETLYAGESVISHSYVPALHPQYLPDIKQWPYDFAAATALLGDAGFLDINADGVRQDLLTGQDFRITLLTSLDHRERQIGEMLQEFLGNCGIDLSVEHLSEAERTAVGEENRINGRRFDLALSTSLVPFIPDCDRFTSAQISGPSGETNLEEGGLYAGWQGANRSGWSDPAYDIICAAAINALPGSPEQTANHQEAQRIFAENLPVLPLFLEPRITVTGTDLLHVNNNPSQESELWNLFALELRP